MEKIEENQKLATLKEASVWASEYLKRNITVSNISYLVNYGRIKKHDCDNGIFINLNELKKYYDSSYGESKWKKKNDDDINWHLSFAQYKESERTKHVHRLHPYKGKFIPQLVEYFLDEHKDEYKKEVYFNKGDIVLDPFCGSGTTLVQANELGIDAIGIEVSEFNSLISNVKVKKHNLNLIADIIHILTEKLKNFQKTQNNIAFDNSLSDELSKFNNKYFPSPDYKRNIINGEINEERYALEKEKLFLDIYNNILRGYNIKIKQERDDKFLDRWFLEPVRNEIDFLLKEIEKIDDLDAKEVIMVVLSRTVRSSRATTHADLATLKEPVMLPYYCKKHRKICKPIYSMIKWWEFYTADTLKRMEEFERIRTDTFQVCLTADSRYVELYDEIKKIDQQFYKKFKNQKAKGIFTSPPYVGLIDYHEQHAYAYEMFGFNRRDDLEVGSLSKGYNEEEKKNYIKGVADILNNSKKYLSDDYNVFLVANDKFNLYPNIAELAGMKIVNCFKRPVLNRVEKDRDNLYIEKIFHLKEK